MLYDKIGKFFNIMTTPISHNGNVKRDLWPLNDQNYNITSQIDYPYIYDQKSIQELLAKFNKVKFKDIPPSTNLLHKQRYSNRFLFKIPDLKRHTSCHSKLYNYNLTTLEEENHQKINKKTRSSSHRIKKEKQGKKYFKIQLNDMDKSRSIKFDLHPMVEMFMKRTMDKLISNIRKRKQYQRKTKKRSDDEDEVREKLRIMQILKDLHKEEEEEKRRNKQTTQLSVTSISPTSHDLAQEDDGAGDIQQTSHISPDISTSLSKSVNSSGLPTVTTSEQSGASYDPITNKTKVVTIDPGVDSLERKLSVFDPENSDSPATGYTSQHSVNVSAKIGENNAQLHVPDNVPKQEMVSPKLTRFDRKQTNDFAVQNVDIIWDNKSGINFDKSTSSHDLMKKDATTITEPNSKTKSTTKNKILNYSDSDHIMYPLYNIQVSRSENNIYKQIDTFPPKKVNIIEDNILNSEQTDENTITDFQFCHHHKIPNKNVMYFNYKSPMFQIKLKKFLNNKVEKNSKDLIKINGRNAGNVEIPYRLTRGNIKGFPKIKEENSFCYNIENNITKKHSRISMSKIIRKLAATCACHSIKSTNVGDAKSYDKDNLYFNKKLLLNSEKTNVYNKIDKTIANQCVNRINKKNEIAETLRRINSLTDESDNLGNFLKELKRMKEDGPRIGTTVASNFQESRTKSSNSNIGKQKYSDCVRNEPQNNNNKYTFPKNCQHIIMPIYINIDKLNSNEDWESSENENSSETNSISSKTFPKTTTIPAPPKKVYLENFRKPNKETVNKILNVEQSEQYNNSFFHNENTDGELEEIKSIKLYNSIAQCLPGKKILVSTFMQNENSMEQNIDCDLGTEKRETGNIRNSKESYEEIIQIAGNNAVTESNYLSNHENNNQSTIQLNVNRQNFKTVDFNSYTDTKSILPKCIDNLIVTEEKTGQENYVNNEIEDDNKVFEQPKNSNKSKQNITNSNGNSNYFKHKKTKQILQENQQYERTDPVNERKLDLIEIYETSSKKTISQSSETFESTPSIYGNLLNGDIVWNEINSSYIDTNDTEKNISSETKNNTLNSGYTKHEEVYNVNNDQDNTNDNDKITREHIPLLNIEQYDTYSTGRSTNKLIHSTPSAISISKNINFSNQTENTESTLLFSLNSEFYINETNTNKSMITNNKNHEVNIKIENKSPLDTIYETLSQQLSSKNIDDKPVNDVNNKRNKEISKENFKQTIGTCNKSIANFNDEVYEKCIRNSISVIYV